MYLRYLLIVSVSFLLGYVLNVKKEDKEVNFKKEIIFELPKYVKDDFSYYQIQNINESNWNKFLQLYLDDNIEYKVPKFILEDIEKYGINSDNLNEYKWKKFLRLLIEKINFSENSLLHLSARSGRIELEKIKELINLGYDINSKNEKGKTYLQILLSNLNNIEDISTIDSLILLGVELNSESYEDVFINGFVGKKDTLNYLLENENSEVRDALINYFMEKGLF